MSEKKLFAVDLGASGGKCFVGFFGDGTFRMRMRACRISCRTAPAR
jgi:hypothetical protein